MYGPIHSAWEKVSEGYKYSVTIPANTNATLSLDALVLKNVSVQKGKEGILSTKYVNGKAQYNMEAGSYEFTIKK